MYMKKNNNKTFKLGKLAMPSGYSMSIHAMIIILNLFGFLMILSANMTAGTSSSDLTKVAVKEVGFIVISYFMMVQVAKRFSFKKFQKYYPIITIGIFLALLSTLAFGGVGGAKAWIRLGPITLQPSEFAKIYVILLFAYWFGDRKSIKPGLKRLWKFVRMPILMVLAIGVIVVILQSDLGSGVVVLGIAYITLLVPGNPVLSKMQKVMFGLMFFGFFLLFFLTTTMGVSMVEKLNIPPYMIERFKISSNPFSDRYGFGYYQIFNGIVALVKGGLFGVGYGQGFIKYSYLPESQNDAILSVVVEELGMVGFSIILIGYGVIMYQLIKYAFKVKSERDKMILIGTLSYIMIHFVFNIGGITAFIPLTGVPLLLISAGGSSRMAIMIAIGLAQNVIARYRSAERKRRMQSV